MMSVGTQLQQARGERKLSLSEVTKHTKIQTWVLEALEGDRLHDMMSPVYVRGFLTTYAKFLRLAPEPLIAQLLPPPPPEPVAAPLPPPVRVLPAFLHWRAPEWVWRRLAGVAAATALAALVVSVHPMRWISKFSLPAMRTPRVASVVTHVSEPSKPPTLQSVPLAPVQPLALSLSAHRTTWIQLKADGKLLLQQRLPRGANGHWIAKKQFELIVSMPSDVDLTLNGQSISPFAVAHQGRLLITHRGITQLPGEE